MNAEAKLLDVAQRRCDFHRGFLALQEEHCGWVNNIRGAIPADLAGTLFRNGPGAMNAGAEAYGHWFDGPGMISAVTFHEGRAHFKNRYVRTPKFLSDRKQGRVSNRGFGTQIRGGIFSNLLKPLANPANTSVSWHGDKLCAFYEGGQPYRLDPHTLETEGPEFYGETLKPWTTISAHGKTHPTSGRQVNFGVNLTGIGWRGVTCALDVHDIAPDGGSARSLRIPLRSFPFLHDFALTETHALFLVSSVDFGLTGPLLGTATLSETLKYDPRRPMRGILVDLRDLKVAREFDLPPGIVVHFANAFDRGDEFVADFFHTENTEGFAWLDNVFAAKQATGSQLYRLRLNRLTGRTAMTPFDTAPIGEFPAWNTQQTGLPTEHCFFVGEHSGEGFFNSLVTFNTETGACQQVDVGDHRYTSEALFAAKSRPTSAADGYLLAFIYDALSHRTEVQIRDAQSPDIEYAAVLLDHHVPFGFHGHFTPETFLA